jgi:hypothetical protein
MLGIVDKWNDLVFDNSPMKTYMQVLYRGTYWLRLWSQLQKHEDRARQVVDACRALETMVMEVLAARLVVLQ